MESLDFIWKVPDRRKNIFPATLEAPIFLSTNRDFSGYTDLKQLNYHVHFSRSVFGRIFSFLSQYQKENNRILLEKSEFINWTDGQMTASN